MSNERARDVARANSPVSVEDVDFRAVFDAAPGAHALIAPDAPRFTLLAATDERLAATLTARESTIGRGLFDVFIDANPTNPSPTGVQALRTSLETVLRTKSMHAVAEQRFDLQRPDGAWEERWWAWYSRAVLDDAGEVRYLLHTIVDVTDPRRRRAADVVRTTAMADPRMRAQAVAERLRREATERADVLTAMNARLQSALRAAEAANVAKSAFLARMSHELRTPLNSVIGFARVLLRNRLGNLTPSDLQYLDRIARNGRHLLGLIDDILDLAKVESGKTELHTAPVSLALLVHDTVAELEGRSLQQGVELRAEVPEGLELFETDATKLKQIIINLVGNALKFTAEGIVTVRVVADAPGRRPIRMDVQDTGVGIAPERISVIFEAFEQADASVAAKYGGTGLGLSISRAFAALLGYKLAVRSTVGVGSIFSVLLAPDAPLPEAPLVRPAGIAAGPRRLTPAIPMRAINDDPLRATRAPSSSDTAHRAPATAGRPAVLVIDDSDDTRTILCEALGELDVSVLQAASGEEGIELARRERPAAILLNLLMPGMSGWEVLSALRADPSLAATPVLMASALPSMGRPMYLGAVDFVDKRDLGTLLPHLVRRHLDLGGGRRALVVDDEADARRLAIDALVEVGEWEVREAHDGIDALAKLEAGPADLVIIDLLMPRMSGFTFLTRMRGDPRFTLTPAIILSSKNLTVDERTMLARDTAAAIEKSSDVERLVRETARRLGLVDG